MSPEDPPVLIDGSTLEQRSHPRWGWKDIALFFGLAFPVIVVLQVLLGAGARMFHRSPSDPQLLLAGQGVAYVILFALLAMILRVEYDLPFWRSLGWVRARISAPASVGAGVALAFGLAMLGGWLHIQEVDSPIKKILGEPNGPLILLIFGVLVAPLAEELAFRGFLQPVLVRTFGAVAGILITGCSFGMLHWAQNQKSWGYAGILSLAGIALGTLRHVSGSTRTSVLAHMAYNGTLMVALLGTLGRKIPV